MTKSKSPKIIGDARAAEQSGGNWVFSIWMLFGFPLAHAIECACSCTRAYSSTTVRSNDIQQFLLPFCFSFFSLHGTRRGPSLLFAAAAAARCFGLIVFCYFYYLAGVRFVGSCSIATFLRWPSLREKKTHQHRCDVGRSALHAHFSDRRHN